MGTFWPSAACHSLPGHSSSRIEPCSVVVESGSSHRGSSIVMFDWWMSGGSVSSDFIIAKIYKIYKIIKFDLAKNRSKKNDRFSSRPKKPPFLPGPQKTPLFRGKQQKSAIFPKIPFFRPPLGPPQKYPKIPLPGCIYSRNYLGQFFWEFKKRA